MNLLRITAHHKVYSGARNVRIYILESPYNNPIYMLEVTDRVDDPTHAPCYSSSADYFLPKLNYSRVSSASFVAL